ncbi:MAG: hypothetical protein M1833_005702 [Piccolia ochrophora]|nr:MAG: hypothetical protein M1833_005702 [Piccolia ochrophora]
MRISSPADFKTIVATMWPPDFLRSIALNATSSTTTSPSSSSTASPSSSASSCPSSSSTGKEAAIGAGVGVPLGLALLISTLLFLREHRLRKRDTAQDSSIPPHSLPMSPHPYSISGTHELPFSDGGSTKRPDSEMAHAPAPRQKPPVELGDNNNAG